MSKRILVTDDSPVARFVVQKSLKMAGLTSAEYLEAGLIMMDLNMPGMTGYELLPKLELNPRLRDIPTIIVSTERSEERLRQLLTLPTRKYLSKPFTPDRLRVVLQELFPQGFEAAA
jgi:two-component system chemotaxis response regulator CheY